jgi:hypothetical protein
MSSQKRVEEKPKQPTQSKVVVNKTKQVKVPEMKGKRIIGPDGKPLTDEEMEIARQQLEGDLGRGNKNPYDMSHDELIERNKQIKGQKKSSKVRGIPMPSSAQVEMMYQNRVVTQSGQDERMNTILSKVLSQK